MRRRDGKLLRARSPRGSTLTSHRKYLLGFHKRKKERRQVAEEEKSAKEKMKRKAAKQLVRPCF